MANVLYTLTRDLTKSGGTFVGGIDRLFIAANSTAEAQALAEAAYGNDVAGVWAALTPAVIPIPDFNGAVFNITVKTAGGALTTSVTITGDSVNKTIDLIAAELVTALNTAGPMANASYNASTNVLTVSSIADNIGDHVTTATVTMPTPVPYAPANIVTAISAPGIAGSAITVTYAADTYVPPAVLFADRQAR